MLPAIPIAVIAKGIAMIGSSILKNFLESQAEHFISKVTEILKEMQNNPGDKRQLFGLVQLVCANADKTMSQPEQMSAVFKQIANELKETGTINDPVERKILASLSNIIEKLKKSPALDSETKQTLNEITDKLDKLLNAPKVNPTRGLSC